MKNEAYPWCGIAGSLVFLLLVPLVARGQASMIPPAFYAVEGAPFTATIESVWKGNSQTRPGRSLSRVVRDTAGRQRFEIPTIEEAMVTGQQPHVVIYDPVMEKVIKLDMLHRTAVVTPMTQVGRTIKIDPAVRRGFPCRAAQGGKSLGVRWVAGLETCGLGLPGRELWLSTNYLMPLMEVRSDMQRGELTQILMKLDVTEPDAELFEVPAGYSVVHP